MKNKSTIVSLLLLLAALFVVLSPAVPSLAQSGSSQPAADKASAAAPKEATPSKINLNTADSTSLASLPGVGPKTAEEIVKYREANGPFKTIEDCKQVKGIGDKKFELLKDKLTVE